MPAEPLTLFEILGVSHDATHLQVRMKYEQWKIGQWRQSQVVPEAVEAANRILGDAKLREFYVELLEARRHNRPLLKKVNQVGSLNDF